MKLHIDKESELTAYEQLREQIIFLISTGEIRIGEEMPSVRGLARQLGISSNTVSKVYSGLVRGAWLIDRPGAHHIVVERKRREDGSLFGASLDELIDRTISVALGTGFTLQQLADHLRERLLQQAPDHMVIAEPEAGIGQIMREEIRERIGYAPPTRSLTSLQANPALGVGALLIAPVYIVERLGHAASDRTRIVAVSYSPIDSLIAAISRLSKPSMIGWVSVSEAGLKTMTGMAAHAISNRHSSHTFVLERADANNATPSVLRRFRVADYRPSDILKAMAQTTPTTGAAAERRAATEEETVSVSELRCMDMLFLDSIASRVVEHPHAIRYRLLSKKSLEKIQAAADRLG
jgi:GntR family transcriptional regulator